MQVEAEVLFDEVGGAFAVGGREDGQLERRALRVTTVSLSIQEDVAVKRTMAKATPRVVKEKTSRNSGCALPQPRAVMRLSVSFLTVCEH